MKAQQELPLYRTHSTDETVRAVKIAAIEINVDHARSATVTPANHNFSPFKTQAEWTVNYKGTDADKGYFVQYADGFASWLSSSEFEAAYTLATDV